jgi:hypothetical protein
MTRRGALGGIGARSTNHGDRRRGGAGQGAPSRLANGGRPRYQDAQVVVAKGLGRHYPDMELGDSHHLGSASSARTRPNPTELQSGRFSRMRYADLPYLVTLSLVVTVCVRVPLLPVIVSVKVPLGPDDDVLTLSVDGPVAGFGENVTLEPDGWPLRLRVTDPENPLDGVTVTV